MIGSMVRRVPLAAMVLVAALPSLGGPAHATSVFDTPLVSQLASGTTAVAYDDFITGQFGIGDLNGDGFPDVTSAVPGESLTVHLGRGDGTLAMPIVIATPGGSDYSTVADFDGDGFVDIAWAGWAGAGISFGDGTGQDWTTVLLPCTNANGIAAGDFDGDGIVDVAILSETGGTTHLQTFLSRPQRTSIAVSQPLTMSGRLIDIRVSDLDRDGRVDLCVFTYGGDWTLRSLGDGTFAPSTLSQEPNDADVADVTGDGIPDLVEVDRLHLSVCPGLGSGSFGTPRVIDSYLSTPFPNLVRIGDLDGDGIPDLVTVDVADRIVTYLGTGAGAYGPPHATRVGQELFPIELADMDRDERLDVLGMSASARGMFVARGDGAGGFVGHVTTLPMPHGALPIAGDLDGDGHPDLLLVSAPTNQILAMLSRPGRTWSVAPAATITNAYPIAIADFNEDGKADALVFTGGRFDVLPGNGDGTFQAPVVAPGGNTPAVVGDVDGDGHLDLVYVSGDSIVVLPGRGDGSFAERLATATPYAINRMTIGDLDGDGLPDLALRCLPSGYGLAPRSFAPTTQAEAPGHGGRP